MTLVEEFQNAFKELKTLAGANFVEFTYIGSYNSRGDLVLSGSDLWVSGVSGTCIIQPRRYEEAELMLNPQGRRIEGTMVAYLESGINLEVGGMLRTQKEDYEITHLTVYSLAGSDIYSRAILNKIDNT